MHLIKRYMGWNDCFQGKQTRKTQDFLKSYVLLNQISYYITIPKLPKLQGRTTFQLSPV